MIKKILLIIFSISLVFCVFYTNATKINTTQYSIRQETLQSDKIDANLDGLLIAYFADLHYGKYIDDGYVNKVLDTLNSFKPDIIIFGGDLINNTSYDLLKDKLSLLEAKYGKYAILGENDNKEEVKSLLNDSDFIILDNDMLSINVNKSSSINIIGLNGLNNNYNEAFEHLDNNKYTIVVSHYPDVMQDIINYNFDYMLAGHSHGGEIYLPIISLFNRQEGCQKYYHGKYKVDNKVLDITNGVGRSLHNARLFADGEIVLYTLTKPKTD